MTTMLEFPTGTEIKHHLCAPAGDGLSTAFPDPLGLFSRSQLLAHSNKLQPKLLLLQQQASCLGARRRV